ncbi:hypothetical protein ACMAV8_05965 [Helicobacter pylori]
MAYFFNEKHVVVKTLENQNNATDKVFIAFKSANAFTSSAKGV